MGYRLGLLPGDGIGFEIVPPATAAVDAALQRVGADEVEWVELPMGWAGIEAHGDPLPDVTRATLAGLHGWVMGPHDSASYPAEHREGRNPSGELRHHFDLYANVRPARSLPGVPAVAEGVDLVIVRENTEGFYTDRNMHQGVGEFMPTSEVALAVGVFTREAARRIAHSALRLARARRRHVTVVHKANVLKQTTGLFLDMVRETAADYPDVVIDDFHVDAMAAHLVRRASDFDVIVTENMFGDILSDLTGELVGALGMAPSLNAGEDRAMAQAAHGSAPDIAGQGIANPIGMISSAAMLLQWLADRQHDPALGNAARVIDDAIATTLAGGVRTRDLGGEAGTATFTDAVTRAIADAADEVGG